jgi:hypothetical protein
MFSAQSKKPTPWSHLNVDEGRNDGRDRGGGRKDRKNGCYDVHERGSLCIAATHVCAGFFSAMNSVLDVRVFETNNMKVSPVDAVACSSRGHTLWKRGARR